MKVFFTSDTHLGHANIMKYCNRPFTSVDEMDKTIIDNINKVVGRDDTLFHLGDFSFRGGRPINYRRRIHCQNIVLILGNHDPRQRDGTPEDYLYDCFSQIWNLYTFKGHHNGEKIEIVLCHYAMRVWDKSHHGAYHLYGHSHHTLPDDPTARSLDVGVDAVAARTAKLSHLDIKNPASKDRLDGNDFRPMSLEEVIATMAKKQFKPIDHHGA